MSLYSREQGDTGTNLFNLKVGIGTSSLGTTLYANGITTLNSQISWSVSTIIFFPLTHRSRNKHTTNYYRKSRDS